jgi:deazaflavin-dependent oxidoreductase (nitroreductase family)
MSHALRALVLAIFATVFLHAPWMIRLMNPVFKRYLGLGLPGGPNVLLTVRGRTSGRPRGVPVAFLGLDGRQFVQASYGDVNWARNIRAAGEAVLTKGRSTETVTAVELTPEAAAPILRDALAPYRASRLVRRVVGPIERPPVGVLRYFRLRVDDTIADYVAEARRHPIFELRRLAAGDHHA